MYGRALLDWCTIYLDATMGLSIIFYWYMSLCNIFSLLFNCPSLNVGIDMRWPGVFLLDLLDFPFQHDADYNLVNPPCITHQRYGSYPMPLHWYFSTPPTELLRLLSLYHPFIAVPSSRIAISPIRFCMIETYHA